MFGAYPLSPPYQEFDVKFDNGEEFVNHQFHAYFQTLELKNKHILEISKALLIVSHAPNKYWEDSISTLCIFLGYATYTKGYCCYDPIRKCHYTTMDATFLEFESYYSPSTTSDPQGVTWNEDLK
ncbi:hypothetical protein CR513_17877, partial [Mucuna pruriens]